LGGGGEGSFRSGRNPPTGPYGGINKTRRRKNKGANGAGSWEKPADFRGAGRGGGKKNGGLKRGSPLNVGGGCGWALVLAGGPGLRWVLLMVLGPPRGPALWGAVAEWMGGGRGFGRSFATSFDGGGFSGASGGPQDQRAFLKFRGGPRVVGGNGRHFVTGAGGRGANSWLGLGRPQVRSEIWRLAGGRGRGGNFGGA